MRGKTCTIPGCDKPYRSRGTCWGHRSEEKIRERYTPGSTCSVAGCDRKPKAMGMCGNHRRTFRKHGDPTANGHQLKMDQWQARFWANVYPCPVTGCWHWGAAIFAKRGGYGNFCIRGKSRKAHVVAYELLVGPVSDGLVLDHLCRVTCCVNPDHLEPVTPGENTRRAHSPSMLSRQSGRCVSGLHLMTPDNVYIRPDNGRRWCRACEAIRTSRRASSKLAHRPAV
jgi:hypothetical protein